MVFSVCFCAYRSDVTVNGEKERPAQSQGILYVLIGLWWQSSTTVKKTFRQSCSKQ